MKEMLYYLKIDLASIKYYRRSALAFVRISRTYYVIIINSYSTHSVLYNKVTGVMMEFYATAITYELFRYVILSRIISNNVWL